MQSNDVRIDTALVRTLVATQFPQWNDLSIARQDSGGTDHALFRLGDEMLVRLPTRASAVGQIEKEHVWLPKLAPHVATRSIAIASLDIQFAKCGRRTALDPHDGWAKLSS